MTLTHLAQVKRGSLTCAYFAPFFGLQKTAKSFHVIQGCCNHWDCPRCGVMRAKKEYGRIVEGCRTLSKNMQLWFITITCRGRDLSLKEAEAGYLKWTNRLLTALRKDAKKRGVHWSYAQVTERQKRGHPHSHILTTYYPDDVVWSTKKTWKTIQGVRTLIDVEAWRSEYLQKRVISAGLGDQYDISKVRDFEAASRYVAKYMFKETMFEKDLWGKGWRRVRYSQSFPKLPEKPKSQAFPLITHKDWLDMEKRAVVLTPQDNASLAAIQEHLYGSDVIVRTSALK